MEPTSRTHREIGRLCTALAYLESISEITLWGILGIDSNLGPLISWKQDLRGRWTIIMEYAPRKHDELEILELRTINKDIIVTMRDRNIIVHGLVHAEMMIPNGTPRGSRIPGGPTPVYPITTKPCWTIFKGEDKGKRFPISTDAVKIVSNNIKKIVSRVEIFNSRHNYHESSIPSPIIDESWPKQLP